MEHERRHHSLSLRERQLIEMAAAGKTDAEIAHELGIAIGTVATYWGRIRSKFGGCSRTELVAMALREEYEYQIARLRATTAGLAERLHTQPQEGASYDTICHAVLEAVPEAILTVDPQATIRYANPAAEELFGYTKGEMIGQPLTLLLPDRYHAVHRQHVADYFERPERKTMGAHMATPARHKLGREFAILATLACTQTPTGPLTVCVVRPTGANAMRPSAALATASSDADLATAES